MPMIYRRFTDKTAEEWRQIYKALQLLEFLIKNGAEQVIDDARSHLSTIKMLRQFYYIDEKGKDQGVNVRNRAKELAELLSDVDRIRQERKKARQTKSKYTGVEGGYSGSGGFNSTMGGMSGSSRFRGFGSESSDFGGYPGQGVYGDGGGFGGRGPSGFQDDGYSSHSRSASRNNTKFDEYDEYDDGGASSRRTTTTTHRSTASTSSASKPAPLKKTVEPEIDLLGGDDGAPSKSTTNKSLPAPAQDDDDDFDDFQTAPPAKPQHRQQASVSSMSNMAALSSMTPPPLTSTASGLSLQQPKPVSTNQQSNMNSLVGLTSPAVSAFASPAMTPATTGSGAPNYSAFSAMGAGNNMSSMAGMNMGMGTGMSAMKPVGTGYQPQQPNYFTSVPVSQPNSSVSSAANSATPKSAAQPAKKAGNDAFGNIWNQASAGVKKAPTPTGKTPSLQSMAQEKASAGLWGAPAAASPPPAQAGQQKYGGGLDDLLG
jgi:epsin